MLLSSINCCQEDKYLQDWLSIVFINKEAITDLGKRKFSEHVRGEVIFQELRHEKGYGKKQVLGAIFCAHFAYPWSFSKYTSTGRETKLKVVLY